MSRHHRNLIGSRVPADLGEAPALVNVANAPPPNTTLAAFTALELDTMRKVCRDADNENARRILEAALARAAK